MTVTAQEGWLSGVVTDVRKWVLPFLFPGGASENRRGTLSLNAVPLREQRHQGSAGLGGSVPVEPLIQRIQSRMTACSLWNWLHASLILGFQEQGTDSQVTVLAPGRAGLQAWLQLGSS